MFRITYRSGNGYHCSCCRSETTLTEDVETREDVVEWLNKLEADRQEPLNDGDNDVYLEEIVEIKSQDLTRQFKFDPKAVKAIIEKRRQQKKEVEEEDARESIQLLEQREKAQLQYLVQKYPDVLKNPILPNNIDNKL